MKRFYSNKILLAVQSKIRMKRNENDTGKREIKENDPVKNHFGI